MQTPPPASNQYPWYDGLWLTSYVRAKELIKRIQPSLLEGFVQTLACLQTRPDYQVKLIPRVFSDATVAQIKELINNFHLSELKMHEARRFGRFVVHDNSVITQLQETISGLVGELAGEAVEPSYNFVSLYKKLGVCDVHMDAPKAKWTLDLCIEQSDPWPIQLSQIVPWPENDGPWDENWQSKLKAAPGIEFKSYLLQPGEAILFSGSSQWHYRDPLPVGAKAHFCHLVFFHFVPKGMGKLSRPKNWASHFGIPELAHIIVDKV